jgi:Flp pilus assembly protein TadG
MSTDVTKRSRTTVENRKRGFLVRAMVHAEAGTALVELAVVAPLLFLLLISLVEIGRYGDYAIKVTTAARAGAQYGAQNRSAASDNTGIINAVNGDAGTLTGLQPSPAPTTFCQCSNSGTSPSCLSGDCPTSVAFPSNHRLQYVEVDTRGTLPSILNYSGLPASLRTVTVNAKSVLQVSQ